MRHYQDPRNAPLFRNSELIRLMTMVVMLGVVGMLVFRARDPRTWRWLANDNEKVSPATLAAFDKATAKRRQAAKSAASRKSAESEGRLALAPETPPAAAPPDQKPTEPPNPKPETQPANQPPLADDVPPPDPATDPQVVKAEKATETPATSAPTPTAETPNTRPETQSANAPSPESLTADIPPPQPATDPDYLRKITESEHSPSPGAASSPGYADAAAVSSGPSTSRPFEPSSETAGTKGAGQGMVMEELAVDEDPEERKDFDFECQAIDDKAMSRPEEMLAYWRLVRWAKEQTFKQMDRRARPGMSFSDFFEHPDRYRGKLVRLKIRVARARAVPTEENGNGLGVERLYDLWGCTEESSPNPYALAVLDLPADFPLGHGIQEDVTFVGFFLKLVAYKARDDKTRAAPLLIGRIVWHPVVLPVSPVNTNLIWIGLAGGLVAVMLVVRMTFTMRPLRRPSKLPPLHEGEEGIPIETWLERVEGAPVPGEESPEAINHHANGDNHSNGAGHVFPQNLDPTEDPER